MSVEDIMRMLHTEILRVVDNPKESWWNEEWWEEWMEDIAVYPCTVTHSITDEESNDIITALNLLNHHTASSREEYIKRISENRLAMRVKLKDLENNMDISRIPDPTEKDIERINRYKKEYDFLLSVLSDNKNNKPKTI